jgi:MoaA/NifB/PqqE/SkfB family radical SAM enzyme
MGMKDIGFGITVSNSNSADMLKLYKLSNSLGMEFATEEVCGNFEKLINLQLKEPHPKSWFRAYFNRGLINYIQGNLRLLPCESGLVNFFVEPYGDIYPCNGLEEKYWQEKMGNIRKPLVWSVTNKIRNLAGKPAILNLCNHCRQ